MDRIQVSSELPMLEGVTKSLPWITTDHEYIHKGGFFEVVKKITLTSGSVKRYAIQIPSLLSGGKYIHYRNEKISTSGDKLDIIVYEDVTLTDGVGTDISDDIKNHRRIGTIPNSVLTVLEDVTISVASTHNIMTRSFIGGGTGVGSTISGSETTDVNEWVLDFDKNYVIELTNNSSGSNDILIKIVWYEEDQG